MGVTGPDGELVAVADDKCGPTSDREHARALYLACLHQPSQLLSLPGEKAAMLTEAARTLDRIGDKRGLEECCRLMKSLGTTL